MENIETRKKSGKRKWVITFAVVFLVIVALLTFFSNTIMNMSLTKVSAQWPQWGTISVSNRASGVVEAVKTVEVKAFDTRKVEQVFAYDYYEVMEGDLLLTLEPVTQSDDLDALKKELEEIELQRYYDGKMPVHAPDYSSFEDMIESADTALTEAKTALSNAQNKSTIVSTAQTTVNTSSALIIQLTSEIEALSTLKATLEQELSELQYERDEAVAALEQEWADAIADKETEHTDAVTLKEQERDAALDVLAQDLAAAQAALDAVPEGDDNTAEQAEVDRLTGEIETVTAQYQGEIEAIDLQYQGEIEAINLQYQEAVDAAKAQYQPQIDQHNVDITRTDSQLSSNSTQLVTEQTKLAEAEAKLAEAEMYPTVTDAEKAVSRAEKSLQQAKTALSDQKQLDWIESEKAKKQKEDDDKYLQDLKDKITAMEKNMGITEIRAPISGQLTGFSVNPGQELMKDQILGMIIDLNGGYKADFIYSTEQARRMSVGMQLNANMYQADRVIVTRILPNPSDPRNSRIVSTSVEGENMWVGGTIDVTFDDYNQSYECMVPNSAIHEDSSGKFVYVLTTKSGPLGERHIASKVTVEVLATDGRNSALDPAAIQGGQIITRTEKPIENGDQVRLEYFQQEG